MVDYHSSATIAQDFGILVKLWHFIDGVFLWEFFTTLYYEWDVFRGNRPYGWTIWVYSSARVAALMCIILNMVGFNTASVINCQVWVTFEVALGYLAVIASSLLIVLRIIAIWNMAEVIIVISLGIWVADILFALDGIVRLRSTWSPEINTCVPTNLESTKLSTFFILFADVVLLLIMLIGLIRMRSGGGGIFNLGRILWKQGLIWLLVATVAEVPPTVYMILDLNVPLALIPQTPCMIIVTIAATRMYRSLLTFCTSNVIHETPGGGHTVSEIRIRPRIIPLNRTEVTVRTERAQFSTSESWCDRTDQERFKAHEVSLSGDVESGLEK